MAAGRRPIPVPYWDGRVRRVTRSAGLRRGVRFLAPVDEPDGDCQVLWPDRSFLRNAPFGRPCA